MYLKTILTLFLVLQPLQANGSSFIGFPDAPLHQTKESCATYREQVNDISREIYRDSSDCMRKADWVFSKASTSCGDKGTFAGCESIEEEKCNIKLEKQKVDECFVNARITEAQELIGNSETALGSTDFYVDMEKKVYKKETLRSISKVMARKSPYFKHTGKAAGRLISSEYVQELVIDGGGNKSSNVVDAGNTIVMAKFLGMGAHSGRITRSIYANSMSHLNQFNRELFKSIEQIAKKIEAFSIGEMTQYRTKSSLALTKYKNYLNRLEALDPPSSPLTHAYVQPTQYEINAESSRQAALEREQRRLNRQQNQNVYDENESTNSTADGIRAWGNAINNVLQQHSQSGEPGSTPRESNRECDLRYRIGAGGERIYDRNGPYCAD